MTLEESLLGQPRVRLPVIHFVPVEDYVIPKKDYQVKSKLPTDSSQLTTLN
jgi:hypothetical protein